MFAIKQLELKIAKLEREARFYSCPAWWSQIEGRMKITFSECIKAGEAFTECPKFNNRSECWKKYNEYEEKLRTGGNPQNAN